MQRESQVGGLRLARFEGSLAAVGVTPHLTRKATAPPTGGDDDDILFSCALRRRRRAAVEALIGAKVVLKRSDKIQG